MKLNIFLLLICLITVCSCNSGTTYYDTQECDYSTCDTKEPFEAEIKIRFTRNDKNPDLIIYLASGTYDNYKIIDSFKVETIPAYATFIYYKVPVNFSYVVFAKYLKNNDTVIAVDGKYVYKQSTQECDSTCWQIYNTTFNVKLK